MRLPDRLKRPKLGVRSALQKVWPRHRRWVKSHGCCVHNCEHARSTSPIGQRPHNISAVSLCCKRHDEQHRIGADRLGDKYSIDLWALAAEFGRRSPDWQMRASLRIVSPPLLPTSPDPR